jgi:hypothetical protein
LTKVIDQNFLLIGKEKDLNEKRIKNIISYLVYGSKLKKPEDLMKHKMQNHEMITKYTSWQEKEKNNQ